MSWIGNRTSTQASSFFIITCRFLKVASMSISRQQLSENDYNLQNVVTLEWILYLPGNPPPSPPNSLSPSLLKMAKESSFAFHQNESKLRCTGGRYIFHFSEVYPLRDLFIYFSYHPLHKSEADLIEMQKRLHQHTHTLSNITKDIDRSCIF